MTYVPTVIADGVSAVPPVGIPLNDAGPPTLLNVSVALHAHGAATTQADLEVTRIITAACMLVISTRSVAPNELASQTSRLAPAPAIEPAVDTVVSGAAP